jgi:hypothetical protein
MAVEYQVTCIRKKPAHYDPHERIQALGGPGWYKAEDQVIYDMRINGNHYYVNRGGRKVYLVVATRNGREYLKTTDDDYAPDNLLNLPECQ